MRPRAQPTIVIVSHFCPFPTVHGNRSRLVSLLKWLQGRGFCITYILEPLDVDNSVGLASLRELVDRLEVVRAPHLRGGVATSIIGSCARLARALLPGSVANALRDVVRRARHHKANVTATCGTGDTAGDGQIDRWCWSDTCQSVRRAVRRDRPVAVITEYALLSKCLEGLPRTILKVIDTVEVFFRNRERFQVEGLAAPFVCTPTSELAALNRADLLVAIQKNDAQALKDLLPGKPVITVPHTYPQGRPRGDSPETGTVLYVGSSNPFNIHGLQQFLTHAWPRILERVPNASLRVVGSLPPRLGAEHRQLLYVGQVSDDHLLGEYQRAHVVINPQVAGTGLKIKCVEALSAGCPLVTNQAGADGLEEGVGTAFLMAKDWSEFSAGVVTILTDDMLRRRLETASRQFGARMFSEEATFSELERALRQHLTSLTNEAS